MKPVLSLIGFTIILIFMAATPVIGQQAREQDPAVAFRQEQLDMRWAAYTAKVEQMKRINKRQRLALEAEYNALIDEIDALYHLRPAKADQKKEPMIVGSIQRASRDNSMR